MRRSAMIMAAGVLAAGIWVVWNRPAAGQAQERQATWEYAVCYDAGMAGGAWSGPDRELKSKTAYELYQRLGGEKPKEDFRSVDTLNGVGEAGWEMIAVHEAGLGYYYYFKRPAR